MGDEAGLNEHEVASSEVRRLVARARQKYGVPAIALATLDSHEIHTLELQGTRIAGGDVAAEPSDYFHIGSCSKSVLAVIAGRLVDEGRLGWKTKFFDLWPELRANSNPDFANITLEDLFQGRAGILRFDSDEDVFPDIAPESTGSRLEFVRYLVGQKPASAATTDGRFEPLHSNASYVLVAAMVEKVTSRGYEELVEETLSGDLHLRYVFGFPNKIDRNQPWGHVITDSGIEAHSPDHDYGLPGLIKPVGDIAMNPVDFATYIQIHLRGLTGQAGYLSAETFRYIHYGTKGISIGVFNTEMGGVSISGMNGSAGTFFCQSLLIPDSDFAFTIMMNAGSGTAQMKAVDWLTVKILKQRFNWWWRFWM